VPFVSILTNSISYYASPVQCSSQAIAIRVNLRTVRRASDGMCAGDAIASRFFGEHSFKSREGQHLNQLSRMPRPVAATADIEEFPGYQIRRMQQIAVAIFLRETEPYGITPVQCAAMMTVRKGPGMDQRTLARSIAFDTSTIAGVIDRLEARGLVRRNMSTEDARVRLITLTDKGRTLLQSLMPSVVRAQDRMLAPLSKSKRTEFMRMLSKLVSVNNELSRAPGDS
jgi:DNA-binding MarR family transcriptional regulator